jgi:hypothetical protein
MPRKKPKYHVIRDSREQENGDGWWFPEGEQCAGTLVKGLKTGDYTLEGFEEDFVIERKSGTAEIAANITQARFERELERMEQFKYPFLIAECTWDDIYAFPKGSGIPLDKQKYLKVTNYFMVRRLCEFQMKYKTKIILAGTWAKRIASSLFKRLIEGRMEELRHAQK